MSEPRGVFAPEQVRQLLAPIRNTRVLSAQGHSHVSQQDITAHLIRMFGFGNFDIEVVNVELVFEQERTDKDGQGLNRFDVCYKALVRLTVRNADGVMVGVYENGSTATAQNQARGDGHDLAYKSAISLSIKRAAIALGDQFGLSLYNKGQLAALVIKTLVGLDGEAVDVQEDVPQQVSLGNDEIDKTDDAPAVEEVPAEVIADWVELLTGAESIAQLQAAWEEAGAAGVTRNPAIVVAKDKRKAAL